MNKILLIIAFMFGSLMAVVAPASALDQIDQKNVKVNVCHVNDVGDYKLINVSENAFQSHVDHGDSSPGDAIPNMSGYLFDANCAPELAPAPEVQFAVETKCTTPDPKPTVSWAYDMTATLVPAYSSYTVEVVGTEYAPLAIWAPTGPQPGDVVHWIGRGIYFGNTAGRNVPANVTITDPEGGVISYSVIVPTGPQPADCPTP